LKILLLEVKIGLFPKMKYRSTALGALTIPLQKKIRG
jgi:hypothetical protein